MTDFFRWAKYITIYANFSRSFWHINVHVIAITRRLSNALALKVLNCRHCQKLALLYYFRFVKRCERNQFWTLFQHLTCVCVSTRFNKLHLKKANAHTVHLIYLFFCISQVLFSFFFFNIFIDSLCSEMQICAPVLSCDGGSGTRHRSNSSLIDSHCSFYITDSWSCNWCLFCSSHCCLSADSTTPEQRYNLM